MTTAATQQPIAAVESEQALIGAALYDAPACAEAFERVRPEHMFDPVHAALWGHLRTGDVIDPVILSQRMGDHPGFAELGGVAFLADLIDRAYLPTVSQHADAVIDAAIRRAIASVAQFALADAATAGRGEALIADVERQCAEIAKDGSTASGAKAIGLTAYDNLEAAMAGEFRGTPCGLGALDTVTSGGLKRDDVWVIGGRSSMGKSVAGLSIARGVAMQNRGVLMFSLEMSEREVQARLISDLAHDDAGGWQLRYSDVLAGSFDHTTRDRARHAARRLAGFPMLVNDRGGLTIDDIRHQGLRQVRAWRKAGVQPGVVLIDHLGLIKPVRKTDSKAADTADTVDQLKDIAKQLECPIVALAQVNRGPENRNDKRPTMGDLNWSGSIEQIADFVCLLYRPAYYLARSADPDDQDKAHHVRHELELLVQKNRSGPIGTQKAWVDVACNAIRDLPTLERVRA